MNVTRFARGVFGAWLGLSLTAWFASKFDSLFSLLSILPAHNLLLTGCIAVFASAVIISLERDDFTYADYTVLPGSLSAALMTIPAAVLATAPSAATDSSQGLLIILGGAIYGAILGVTAGVGFRLLAGPKRR